MITNQIAKFWIVGPRIGRSDPIYGTGIVYIISHISYSSMTSYVLTFHLSVGVAYRLGASFLRNTLNWVSSTKVLLFSEVIQTRDLSSNIIFNPYSLHKNPN